ncbi:hypothetical protein B0H14DRAFT_553858 [Mycena olivaceomarginata]|nr:hypothetical protein B0H14DRAFT_553858 [Mycena olivaceomarginata]
MRWRWIRSRSHLTWAHRCVASHPHLPAVSALRLRRRSRSRHPFLHAGLLAQHLLGAACFKVKFNAQALRWWRWTLRLSTSSSSAARPQLRRAPSRHTSHARRSPSQPDPTSSSGRLQLYTHPARPLHLKSIDSACTSPLTPEY